jgi:hypothetical protein
VCDGKRDCANGDDEGALVCEDWFICTSGEALVYPYAGRCDRFEDCSDGSDEARCGEDEWLGGDGKDDCPWQEDEMSCQQPAE